MCFGDGAQDRVGDSVGGDRYCRESAKGVVMSVVRVLGPVDVVADDGSARGSGSALRRTLLALLATHCGEVLSPGWLMEHLWGDDQPDSGVRALRFHVSQLRKECGELAPIETRPGGYQLDLPASRIDAGLFEQLARQARLESDHARSVELCDEALALWRGEPFVDAAPCPKLDHEAGRLDELRLTVIESLFARRLASGSSGELVSDLSQLVDQHPLREALWSSLIVAQYRAGQQAEALASYERLRANLAETLGLDPSRELQDLQLRVLRQDPDLSVEITPADETRGRSAPHNLPALAAAFIETPGGLDRLSALIDEYRLVTLTGSGGIGKTRLAIEAGLRSLDRFRDGVRLIELAPVVEPDAVLGAVATTLSVRPQPGSTLLESIVEWCHGRQLLLIFDNCEHVIEAIGDVVAALLVGCPTAHILATSREPLGVDGERVHRVASLDRSGGIELFVQRATAADSVFVPDDMQPVGDLCDRLDGVPLAIELAASRSRSMSPTELLERLDDRFRLLRGTTRGRHDRHQTLRATVAWSYQLLNDDERAVFERASVFPGSFDLPAAEVVCACGEVDAADVVDVLGDLVDKSMIVASRHGTTTRYRLLETLREFGEEQLIAHQHADRFHAQHLTYYVELAEDTDRVLRGPREIEARELFEREWHNLRAAHEWALTMSDLDSAERILDVLYRWARSMVRYETATWIDRTLALESDARRPDAHTYGQAAWWASFAGQPERALDRARQGLEAAPHPDHPSTALCWAEYASELRQPGLEHRSGELGNHDPIRQLEITAHHLDLERESWALACLADTTNTTQDTSTWHEHQRHVARLAETAERTGSPSLQIYAGLYQGHDLMMARPSRPGEAIELYRRSLTTAQEINELGAEGDCLRSIALAAAALAADADAAEACRQALTRLYEFRNWDRILQTLESAALTLATLGFAEQAATTLGYLHAHHPAFGLEIMLGFRERSHDLVAEHEHSERWKARGATLDRDQVVIDSIEYLAAATGRHDRAGSAAR